LEAIGEARNQKHFGATLFVWAFGVFVFTPFLFPNKKVASKHGRQKTAQNWLNFFEISRRSQPIFYSNPFH
jgi:hypothetical protein